MRSILAFAFLLIVVLTCPATATVYYVDSAASAGGNGLTAGTAWDALADVTAHQTSPGFVAGDIISLAAGSVFRDELEISADGTNLTTGAIKLTRYGTGDNPIIAGTTIPTGWTANGNVWHATLTRSPSQVYFGGVFAHKEASLVAVNADMDWYWESNVLYVYSATDPTSRYVVASTRSGDTIEGLLRISGDYIIVDGVDIVMAYSRGIEFEAASHVIVRNCSVSYAYGGGIVDPGHPSTDLTVEDCVVHHTNMRHFDAAAENHESITFQGTVGFVCQRNTVHTNYQEGIVAKYGAHSGLIKQNYAYNNGYSADWSNIIQIYVDGAYDIQITQNKTVGGLSAPGKDGFQGIVIGLENNDYPTHDIHVWANLILDCSEGIKIGTVGTPTADISDLYLVNNTFTSCTIGLNFSSAATDDLSGDLIVKNNLFWDNGQDIIDGTTGDQAIALAVIDYCGFQIGNTSDSEGTHSVSTADAKLDVSYVPASDSPFTGAGVDLGDTYSICLWSGTTWPGTGFASDQDEWSSWEIGAFVYSSGAKTFYVGPSATGTGAGTDESNLMVWSSVSANTSVGDLVYLRGFIISTTNIDESWPAGRLYYASGITQWGITWTFNQDYRIGQYCNGDIWVVGSIQITAFTPASVTVDTWTKNGTMINPNPAVNKQGYDSAFGNWMTYDATLNKAFGVSSGSPLSVANGSSVVSTISMSTAGVIPQVSRAAILTVVASVPEVGSFRPPYCGTNKVMAYAASDLDYDILQSLVPDDEIQPLATVEDFWEAPWLDYVPSTPGRCMHPDLSMPDYGKDIHRDIGIGALVLHCNFTDEQKRTLFIRFVQYGLDLYGAIQSGTVFWADGGHDGGRKWPVLFAGIALHDDTITALCHDSGRTYFAEDQQTFYVAQTDIDRTNADLFTGDLWAYSAASWSGTFTAGHTVVQASTGATGTVYSFRDTSYGRDWLAITKTSVADFDIIHTITNQSTGATFTPNKRERWNPYGAWQPDTRDADHVPYAQVDLGMPEWGIVHYGYPEKSNRYHDTYYRPVACPSFNGTALAAVMTPNGRALWNWEPYFDYTERYKTYSVENGIASTSDGWTTYMWDLYWSTYENYDWGGEDPQVQKFVLIRKDSL